MLSLCLTNYDRFDMLLESFEQVLTDHRISEIVISDDCSKENTYDAIVTACQPYPKVKIFRNDVNVGMSRNKRLAIERASNEWCILLDSDNRIDKHYIDAITQADRYPNVINMPDSGGAGLDYTRFAKLFISAYNIKRFLTLPRAEMLLNTCNYFVNRNRYLEVWEHNPEMLGSDTIWFNYLWLKKGGAFRVIPGLRYFHRIHAGSGFMQNVEYNTQKCKEIVGLLNEL